MFVIAIAGVLMTATVQDAKPAPTPSGAVTVKADKVVCRRDESVGTRLGRRTCRKQSEWTAAAGQRRELLLELSDRVERANLNNETPYAKPQ